MHSTKQNFYSKFINNEAEEDTTKLFLIDRLEGKQIMKDAEERRKHYKKKKGSPEAFLKRLKQNNPLVKSGSRDRIRAALEEQFQETCTFTPEIIPSKFTHRHSLSGRNWMEARSKPRFAEMARREREFEQMKYEKVAH